MFLIALGGAIITPDVPATCFWSITLWALLRGWRSRAGSWWLAAGAAAGVCHAFKVFGDLYSSWSIALAAAVV